MHSPLQICFAGNCSAVGDQAPSTKVLGTLALFHSSILQSSDLRSAQRGSDELARAANSAVLNYLLSTAIGMQNGPTTVPRMGHALEESGLSAPAISG